MRSAGSFLAVLAVLCLGSFSANATVSTSWQRQPAHLNAPGSLKLTKAQRRKMSQPSAPEDKGSQSLRQDVARHPNDFLIFETRTAASHFMQDHIADVRLETEPRMIDSGVMGYWRGKTVVVVPIVSSMLDGTSKDKN